MGNPTPPEWIKVITKSNRKVDMAKLKIFF